MIDSGLLGFIIITLENVVHQYQIIAGSDEEVDLKGLARADDAGIKWLRTNFLCFWTMVASSHVWVDSCILTYNSCMDFSQNGQPFFGQQSMSFFQFMTNSDLLHDRPSNMYDSLPMVFLPDHYAAFEQEKAKKEEATEPDYIKPQIEVPIIVQPYPSNMSKSKEKKLKKEGISDEDGDYRPKKVWRPSIKPPIKQKQCRNLIPNTVHQLLSFIQHQFKSKKFTERIFQSLNTNPSYSLPRFYNFHRMLRAKVNTYDNQTAMRCFARQGGLDFDQYGVEEQRFYCLVSRVLARHFLRSHAVLHVLCSRKICRQNLLEHLSVQRFLYEHMISEDL